LTGKPVPGLWTFLTQIVLDLGGVLVFHNR
jgi:hypothetical protein